MNFNTNIPDLSDLKKIYDENGYNHIPELFSKSDMELINKEFDRYIKDCVPKMKEGEVYYVDKTNKDTLMQMQKLEEYDDFFYDLFHNSKIKELAANALGEDVIPRAMEYFNKPPGKSNPTPPHQDGYYFNLDNDKAVTGWLALEDVDDENGCIHYVKGSHKYEGYRPHGKSEILGFSKGVTDFGTEEDKKNTVKFEGKAGMFLMHHAKIIHFADPNKSKTRSRRAFGFVYHGVSAKHDKQKEKMEQEQLKAELKSKNKFGKTITLKLKTSKFRTITRSKTIKAPTQLADVIYRVAFELLIPNSRGTYRLMGVGLSSLSDNIGSVETDFLDDHDIKQEKLEKTIDQIREKVGANAIGKGRGFNLEQPIKKK